MDLDSEAGVLKGQGRAEECAVYIFPLNLYQYSLPAVWLLALERLLTSLEGKQANGSLTGLFSTTLQWGLRDALLDLEDEPPKQKEEKAKVQMQGKHLQDRREYPGEEKQTLAVTAEGLEGLPQQSMEK